MQSVTGLGVETIEHRSDKGTSYTYAPTLSWTSPDGTARDDRLAEWLDEDRARDFIDWFEQRLPGLS